MRIAGGIILVSVVLFSACAPRHVDTPESAGDRCDGQAYLIVSNNTDEPVDVVQSGIRERASHRVLAVVGPRSVEEIPLSASEQEHGYYLRTAPGGRYLTHERMGTEVKRVEIRRVCH